jgi:hypothetical protein
MLWFTPEVYSSGWNLEYAHSHIFNLGKTLAASNQAEHYFRPAIVCHNRQTLSGHYMTTEDLKKDWQQYAVDVQGIVKPLKEIFMICWGYIPDIPDALLFDTGGQQGAPALTLKVENGDDLVSVNPQNPTETSVLGKLVKLP